MKFFRLIAALVMLHVCANAARATEVRGQVLDAQGKGVAGAAVTLQMDGSQPVSTQSREDGSFSFPATAAGSYRLRVQRAGFAEQRQGPFAVAASGPPVELRVRLKIGRAHV